jgi:mannose/fructose/N-acetylgalactosamine-specific phosphotransferase system component IIC
MIKDGMRQIVGLGFCAIAAFLFAARYICAAIFGSNVSSWSAELFRAMYGYVGSGLSIAAGVSLLVGIAYLIRGQRTDGQEK